MAWRSSGVAITKCICSESDPGIKKVSRSIEPLTRLFAQMCFEGPYRNVHSFIQKLVAYKIPPCTPSPLQQMLKFKRAYTTCYSIIKCCCINLTFICLSHVVHSVCAPIKIPAEWRSKSGKSLFYNNFVLEACGKSDHFLMTTLLYLQCAAALHICHPVATARHYPPGISINLL